VDLEKLACLEKLTDFILNLDQGDNNITDTGLSLLARILKKLKTLKALSLNFESDLN